MLFPEVEIISTEEKNNIKFAIPFAICVGIMILDKAYLLFDSCPELFAGADLIYHVIANALSIISQLAASVAAAIVFYYCAEFIGKRRDMERYVDMRGKTLTAMYDMMEFFEDFDAFSLIKHTNGDICIYTINDVSPFYECLKSLNSGNNRQHLKAQIMEFIKTHTCDFAKYLRVFASSADRIFNETQAYRYFRNSLNKAESIKSISEELSISSATYFDMVESGEIDLEDEKMLLLEISENVISFVEEYVDYELCLNFLMTAINRKQVFRFMRYLD